MAGGSQNSTRAAGTVAEDSGSTSLNLAGISYGPGGGSQESGQVLAYTVTALPPATFGRITLKRSAASVSTVALPVAMDPVSTARRALMP